MSLLKEYLTFSKKDRTGILVLLIIMLISISSYFLVDFIRFSEEEYDYSRFKNEIDEFEKDREIALASQAKNKQEYQKKYQSSYKEKKYQSFVFDPNSLSVDSLQLLGIYPKTAQRIEKYRSAGGKFKQPEDLLKVYGFNEKLFTRLKPFIEIKKKQQESSFESTADKKEKFDYNKKKIVNINSADTTELKSLFGIGSKLSNRIVKFRNDAGGFYDLQQLLDVYGLKHEVFEQIKPFILVDENFSRIKINSITAEELKKHPYIYKWNIANAIVNYRSKHGPYKTAGDLMKTDLVSEELSRKIAPYLIFE